MKKIRIATALGSSVVFAALITAQAHADTASFFLTKGNTALTGNTGPYAEVTIDLTSSTTALVTFQSLLNGGNWYLMGDSGAFDLNVNATSFSESAPAIFNGL